MKDKLLVIWLLMVTVAHSQTRQPFKNIGKDVKVVTLTNGEYDEFFDEDSIQRIGSALVNINTMKLVRMNLTKEEKRQLDNAKSSRFLSVDPLTSSFAMLTPYQFASNTPIAAIDLDGLEAKIAIYGAGIKRDANLNIIERHESQFKSEADKDVKQKNSTIALAIHTGANLIKTLKEYTKKEGSLEYVYLTSHASSMGLILDNGQYGREVVGHPNTSKWQGYTSNDIENISKNADIKFAANALVVFAGCNAGKTLSDDGVAIYSVAKTLTEKSSVATIGAVGYTSPSGKNGTRKADYTYQLFYKDENGILQQQSLGKELNQEALDKAKKIVNDIADKVKQKNNETKAPSTDSTKLPNDTTNQ